MIVLLFVLTVSSHASGQPPTLDAASTGPVQLAPARVPQTGSAAQAQLDLVTALLADQQWEEAVQRLCRVMDEYGDELIERDQRRDQGFVRYVPVRMVCQWRLSMLPEDQREALARYRGRVDATAEHWYRLAMESDRSLWERKALLRRVVDEYFSSSYGDDALYLLGEIALEQGNYAEARWHWERIDPALRWPGSAVATNGGCGLPLWLALGDVDWQRKGPEIRRQLESATVSSSFLAYPDSDIRLSDVRARLVLVSILENSRERAQWELDAFRFLHPDARGRLGGRRVRYEEALTQLLAQSVHWRDQPPTNDWTTFASNAERNTVVPTAVTAPSTPIWTVTLPKHPNPHPNANPNLNESSPHPIVVGDALLIHDRRAVHTIDIHSGDLVEVYPRGAGAPPEPTRDVPRVGTPRFTMSAHNGRLFARMGSPVTTFIPGGRPPVQQGYLLGWDLNTKKLLFDKIRPDGPQWAFDGAPVANDSTMYIAMRYSSVNPQAYVAGFDVKTGRLRWRTQVCSGNTLHFGDAEEVTHNLITLHVDRVYFNTNLGAVAGLAADGGAIEWITRYPRKRMPGADRFARPFRDLTPCVYHRGILYVAPADGDQVFALEAMSGQMIWHTSLEDRSLGACRLIGVVGDHLVASGQSLLWLDAATGQLSPMPENPFSPPDGRSGFGEGVLAGDRLYWPVRGRRNEIYVFRHRTGELAQPPVALDPAGDPIENLLLARETLFVTTSRRILALKHSNEPLSYVHE